MHGGDKMKSKILILIGTIVFIVCCGAGLYLLENYDDCYYAKIDNNKVEALPTKDTMKYEYTLDCYNKMGSKKTLKFKTSRKLREAAYLTLEVRTLGVHRWEEIEYEELPKKVQEKLK